MTNDTLPATPSKMPLSAPLWLWTGYVVTLSVIAAAAAYENSVFGAVFAVIFTAAFSFQFWTYAVWRGLHQQHTGGEQRG